MRDRTVFVVGVAAAAAAVLCCAAPALVTLLGALGLSAWLGKMGGGLLPVLIVLAFIVGYAWYRRKHAAACCTPEAGSAYKDEEKHEQL